jgi:hypothetical protein
VGAGAMKFWRAWTYGCVKNPFMNYSNHIVIIVDYSHELPMNYLRMILFISPLIIMSPTNYWIVDLPETIHRAPLRQKEGKRKLREIAKVQVPPEARLPQRRSYERWDFWAASDSPDV